MEFTHTHLCVIETVNGVATCSSWVAYRFQKCWNSLGGDLMLLVWDQFTESGVPHLHRCYSLVLELVSTTSFLTLYTTGKFIWDNCRCKWKVTVQVNAVNGIIKVISLQHKEAITNLALHGWSEPSSYIHINATR